MVDIPLDGRDFADLAYLVPGVGQKAQGASGSNFAVNGARTDNTNFVIDGFNDQSPRGGHRAGPAAHRRHDGVQDADHRLLGRVRTPGRRHHEHGAQVRHQPAARHPFSSSSATTPSTRAASSTRTKPSCAATSSAPCSTAPSTSPSSTTAATAPSSCSTGKATGRSSATRRSRTGAHARPSGRATYRNSVDVNNKPANVVDPFSGGLRAPASPARSAIAFPVTSSRPAALDPIAKQVMAYYPSPTAPAMRITSTPFRTTRTTGTASSGQDRPADARRRQPLRPLPQALQPQLPTRTTAAPSGGFGNNTKSRQLLAGVTYTRLFSPTLINEARIGVSAPRPRDTAIDAGPRLRRGVGPDRRPPATLDMVGFPRFTVTEHGSLGTRRQPARHLPRHQLPVGRHADVGRSAST